jgi:YesN/AraC family two-component response regulator
MQEKKEPFTVVIAEDEKLILKNIADLIEDINLGFKVVATAQDGAEALGLIESLRPSLLITDIRMPKISGLEILKTIREKQIPTQSLIVSSFDYFQYAQEALRYGAREYLLKPVTPRQMEQTLRDLLSVLGKREADKTFSLDIALAGIPQKFPPEFSRWRLFLIHCGNVLFCREESIPFPDWASQILGAETLPDCARCWLSADTGKHYRYLLVGYAPEFDAEKYARELYETLTAASPGEPVLLWTAAPDSGLGIKQIADKLYQKVRRQSVFAASSYRNLGDSAQNGSQAEQYNKYAVYAETIPQALKDRDIAGLKVILKAMIRYWKECASPTETMLNTGKYLYLNAGKILQAPLRLEWERDLEKTFSLSETWDALYEGLLGLFTGLISDQTVLESAKDMMRLIDEYICGHYPEAITNQTLSRRFGFVPSYISKLFRDYKGLSPCEYLTKVRIDRAVKLLEDSKDSNVYDIAKIVGFHDPSYFTRLFKNQTGMLPTEYRETRGQK